MFGPWKTRVPARDNYPLDLDGAERQTRFSPNGNGVFPYPYLIGNVSGFLPQFDAIVYEGMFRRMPWGPSTGEHIYGTYPGNLQYQITVNGLEKYQPSSR